ncbi:SH3 domain-containing protein [Erysipelothrix aquatica]|uniref:SH3 domain-containing protein n=1 Tax=Erysipelothrix aquatica TaxID=2683714 RepID=UPI00191549C7|nr:SH3 domain-containing protein [Erysipelothrix aquatica]
MNRIQKFIGCSFLSILMVGVMITPIAAETDFDSVEGSWIVESLDENGNLVLTEGKAERVDDTDDHIEQTMIQSRADRRTNNHETVRRIFRDDYRRKLTTTFYENSHKAADYGSDIGEAVYAIDDNALITRMGYGINSTWTTRRGNETDLGNYVMYYLPKHNVTIQYAHLQYKSIMVDNGKSYSASTRLGNTGNTGLSYGPHIHVAIARGKHTTLGTFNDARIDFESFKLNGSGGGTDEFTRVPETGYRFYPDRTVNVRDYPSRQGRVVAQYFKGESFAYDSYVVKDGHIWLSYISASGPRRYVAWRVQGGEKFGYIK